MQLKILSFHLLRYSHNQLIRVSFLQPIFAPSVSTKQKGAKNRKEGFTMKKLFMIMLLVVAVFSFSTLNVDAAEPGNVVESQETLEEVEQIVAVANFKIKIMIYFAKWEARFIMYDDSLTDEEETAALEALGARLVTITDAIAAEAAADAALLGYTIICEYEVVTLGTIEVLVDPLRVGGWGKLPPEDVDEDNG